MNEKISNFPKERESKPKEFFGLETAKKELEFLGQQFSKLGDNEKLLESWDQLPKKIDAGDGKKVLSFLETLEFKTKENAEAWRKAVFGISNMVKMEIPRPSKEEVDKFIQQEFSQTDPFTKRDFENFSTEEKIEVVEDEIRKLYSHREFLKKEIADKESKDLTQKQQRQLRKDKRDLTNIFGELLIYRRIRNGLYQEHFQN